MPRPPAIIYFYNGGTIYCKRKYELAKTQKGENSLSLV